MGTKHKSPAELDGMIEHVRYEVVKLINFVRLGNGWCNVLHPDLSNFAAVSVLESGLIHARCVIEFLGEEPVKDQVRARDYVPDWSWKVGERLGHVRHLHGRLAHIGLARMSVAQDGDFSWGPWLSASVPVVLDAMGDFLIELESKSESRYELFMQPRPDLPRIDLVEEISALVPGFADRYSS